MIVDHCAVSFLMATLEVVGRVAAPYVKEEVIIQE
jgi:hypothetical protein